MRAYTVCICLSGLFVLIKLLAPLAQGQRVLRCWPLQLDCLLGVSHPVWASVSRHHHLRPLSKVALPSFLAVSGHSRVCACVPSPPQGGATDNIALGRYALTKSQLDLQERMPVCPHEFYRPRHSDIRLLRLCRTGTFVAIMGRHVRVPECLSHESLVVSDRHAGSAHHVARSLFGGPTSCRLARHRASRARVCEVAHQPASW